MEERELERLLKTSRLKASETEKRQMLADVSEVISFFDRISLVDTNEKPAYHPTEVQSRLREDEVIPFQDVELMKKGRKMHDGYFVGPRL